MKRLTAAFVAAAFAIGCEHATQPESAVDLQLGSTPAGVVPVAPPTGDPAIDVASIEAAVAAANPGDVIQFAAGEYAIEENTQIFVSTPDVTLRGHDRGTTIRGVTHYTPFFDGHFMLNGGGQSIQSLNFDGFGTAVTLGSPGATVGGYEINESFFLNGHAGFGYIGFSDDITVVKDNHFDNLTLAYVILGKTVHFLENDVTATEPEATPFGQPFNVGVLFTEFFSGGTVCENNVFAENTIVGIADGFIMFGDLPGEVCRNNVIRENTFIDQRIYSSGDNATIAWFVSSEVGSVEGNWIVGNTLRGSEGIGVVLEAASGNYIRENEFRDLPGEKEPFSGFPGTGVYLDPLTRFNQVVENRFRHVVTPVVDLGNDNILADNRVVPPPGATMATAAVMLGTAPDGVTPSQASAKIARLRELLRRY